VKHHWNVFSHPSTNGGYILDYTVAWWQFICNTFSNTLIKSAQKNWAIAKQQLNAFEPAFKATFTPQISGAKTAFNAAHWNYCNYKMATPIFFAALTSSEGNTHTAENGTGFAVAT